MNMVRLKQKLSEPSHIAGLVCFRIIFGAIMLWEVIRYFDHGWIERYWITPDFFFGYEGFEWVQPWPGIGMYIHFVLLGILATCIAVGFLYRIAAALFFLGFTYVFLLDQTNYLNHFYLIRLLSFIMLFVPANRAFSLDCKLWPHLRSNWVPTWTIWWLRIQIGLVYFFGGIAKINSDWLRGEPMRMWLARRTDFPLIGQWFTEEWMVYCFSYGGLLLDLVAFPLLLFRKTRWAILVALTLFHLINARLFDIGIFPWFMIVASLIFFTPEQLQFWRPKSAMDQNVKAKFKISNAVLVGVGTYLLVQILVPLRHHLYQGNVNWTEEGHRFAWHMKLRSKTSSASFRIIDHDTDQITWIDHGEFLTNRQSKTMAKRPIMILQFARYLAQQARSSGLNNISVEAEVSCSLNGRPTAFLIDPMVDLSKVEYPFYRRADWIMPLTEPL